MKAKIPPYLLGEVEWPDAIVSGDLLLHITVQESLSMTDIANNITITTRVNPVSGNVEFKLPDCVVPVDPSSIIGLLLDSSTEIKDLFYTLSGATYTGNWVDSSTLGANYLGKNRLFQCITGEPWSDLILFATPRTSSTSPSIEQVAAYLQLTPGDIVTFNGVEFTFGGRPVRF